MKIGLISDTHDHLDPRIPALFTGVEHILHAGDIGGKSVLAALRAIAPITAVLGNTDNHLRGLDLNNLERCKLGGKAFLVIHAGRPQDLNEDARGMIFNGDKPDVVVFGHTHHPEQIVENGVLFVNPGSASRPRMHHPATVAIAEIHTDGRIEAHWLKLS
jgi:putative phosphoesterase